MSGITSLAFKRGLKRKKREGTAGKASVSELRGKGLESLNGRIYIGTVEEIGPYFVELSGGDEGAGLTSRGLLDLYNICKPRRR